MKKVIIILGCIVFLFLFSIYFGYYIRTPGYLLKDRLQLELSKECAIEEFDYDYDSDNFFAKIKIPMAHIREIKQQLDMLYRSPDTQEMLDSMFNYTNSCDWWDLKIDNIQVSYLGNPRSKQTFSNGNLLKDLPHTHNLRIYITNPSFGIQYLYISY